MTKRWAAALEKVFAAENEAATYLAVAIIMVYLLGIGFYFGYSFGTLR
jgi:hypothetical protein